MSAIYLRNGSVMHSDDLRNDQYLETQYTDIGKTNICNWLIRSRCGRYWCTILTNTHEALAVCWFNAGLTTQMLAGHNNIYIVPMLSQCWPAVSDVDPTLSQHWVNVSCLLGWSTSCVGRMVMSSHNDPKWPDLSMILNLLTYTLAISQIK